MSNKHLPRGVTRRELLKHSAFAAGGLAVLGPLAGCTQDEGQAPGVDLRDPRGGDPFDISLTPMGDEFVNPIYGWAQPMLEEEAGIRLNSPDEYPSYGEVQNLLPRLTGGSDPGFNFAGYASAFFGDVIATGGIEPIDRFLEEFDGYDEYVNGLNPQYREFLTRFEGETYGVVCDGDVHTYCTTVRPTSRTTTTGPPSSSSLDGSSRSRTAGTSTSKSPSSSLNASAATAFTAHKYSATDLSPGRSSWT